jgi:hypothetical protein
MADWRPLNSRGGIITDVKFDTDGRRIIRTRQEVDHILDGNKFQRDHLDHRRYDKSLGRKVAEVPATIIHKWLQEGIDIWSGECQDAIARKLNDPDWAYLRTDNGGHIGVSNGVAR